jgi:hypothetical protein
MYIVSFHEFFPDIARTETRSVTVKGYPGLPDGDYGFFESYCDDPSCDCRRVLINVYQSDDFSKIWATINYGWEPIGFYRRWLGDYHALADELKGPALDRFQPQTAYGPALCDLFATLLHDGAYVERLRRHYALVKGQPQPTRPTRTEKVSRGKRKR